MTGIGGWKAESAAPKDTVDMLDGATIDGATPGPITGAFSVLYRADEGIATRVRTRARPGDAHTVWYAISNAPENCSDGACGDDDVFIDLSDHTAGFNAAQIAATRVSVVWAAPEGRPVPQDA